MSTSKEEIREVLKDLLGEEDSRRGKTFVFPDNVDKSYNIVKGLSLANFFRFVLPAIGVAVAIMLIPPYSIGFMMAKMLVASLIMLGAFTFAVLRPIGSRPNITYSNYLKRVLNYTSRQKLYFIRPNQRNDYDA
ncbi:hypothetical protein M1K46_19605 [Fictibacillus sp. WQ 8-8]|uniref:hypothetical protein n=1 Tax=unclassified Fictibacillus TaxID=2644029 RepID=UPI00210EBABB|nr:MULTISPECIES: hypothetical protein [unclassified Fictibacillus]MCQ6267837.1 hypothetical protein [Fictibacillus sp. WQ 8-8]MED2974185.1 hypothetical protein [Fictibacillus sp. B-59209]